MSFQPDQNKLEKSQPNVYKNYKPRAQTVLQERMKKSISNHRNYILRFFLLLLWLLFINIIIIIIIYQLA